MNPAFRLVMLSVMTGLLASALTHSAVGRQTGRRGAGNSAEVERLERERRDREMREADLRERQLLLRNMKPDARPAGRPTPRLATARIREDFVRLQALNNDLAKANSRADALDLKFVSKSAAEIRRLAARLRDNLALPGAGVPPEHPGVKAAPPPAQLGPRIHILSATRFPETRGSRDTG